MVVTMHQPKGRPEGVFRGVPQFFRNCCKEAPLKGYEHAGRTLAAQMFDLLPDGIDNFLVWRSQVYELVVHVQKRDDANTISWLLVHFPKCMRLVPKRRREGFLRGLYAGFEEELGISASDYQLGDENGELTG